jgi:hypothetical protein
MTKKPILALSLDDIGCLTLKKIIVLLENNKKQNDGSKNDKIAYSRTLDGQHRKSHTSNGRHYFSNNFQSKLFNNVRGSRKISKLHIFVVKIHITIE